MCVNVEVFVLCVCDSFSVSFLLPFLLHERLHHLLLRLERLLHVLCQGFVPIIQLFLDLRIFHFLQVTVLGA